MCVECCARHKRSVTVINDVCVRSRACVRVRCVCALLRPETGTGKSRKGRALPSGGPRPADGHGKGHVSDASRVAKLSHCCTSADILQLMQKSTRRSSIRTYPRLDADAVFAPDKQ